jgi:hypothetical protein
MRAKVGVQTRATETTEPYEIEIVIAKGTGEFTSTVTGVCGPGCEELTRWLDDLGEITEHEPTADANKKPEQVRVPGVTVR